MKVQARWIEDYKFMSSSDNNTVAVDADGGLSAPSPMEMILMGLGTNISNDVVYLLQDNKQQITGAKVDLNVDYSDFYKSRVSVIELTFDIEGIKLDQSILHESVVSAIKDDHLLSMMSNSGVEIRHRLVIKDRMPVYQ
ncbi:OsmC family protein [Vibrio sp.]|nr:OsmC family protein [Vibrio sp.]